MFDIYVRTGKVYNLCCTVLSEERVQLYVDGLSDYKSVLVLERREGEDQKKVITEAEKEGIQSENSEA